VKNTEGGRAKGKAKTRVPHEKKQETKIRREQGCGQEDKLRCKVTKGTLKEGEVEVQKTWGERGEQESAKLKLVGLMDFLEKGGENSI